MFRNILKTIPPLFIILLFLMTQNIFGQASGYLFNQTAGTYTAITGGTVLWSGTFDDEFSTAITMPSFIYNGTAYTTIYVSANGYATLGSASLGYTPISSSGVADGVFSVWGRDLNQATTGTPEVRYQTIGNEFIVQWQDVRSYNITGEIFSFQLRLNSSNNTIKFVYGGTITPGANSTNPQVGLRGILNTDFNNRKIAQFGGSWINSAPGTLNTDVMYFNSADPTTVPSVGLTYTFTPPSVLNPTGVTATTISAHQIDVAFTPYNSNNVIVVFNTTGIFTTPVTTPPSIGQPFAGGTLLYNGLVSPYHHMSLNASTTYYYRLFSWAGGTTYSSGISASATTLCEAITSFPWTEGFESVTIPALPNCWFKENGDWVTTNNANSTYDADAHTGTQFLRESYLATNEYIWSPGYTLVAGTSYDFSFYWAGDTYAGWQGDVFVNSSQISTGATQLGTSFVTLDITTTKVYQQALYTFVPPSNGTYYFAIRVNCPTSTPWYLSFDDFRFEPSPSCPMPTSLNVTGITNNSAYIGWFNAALVDIDYGTPGHPAGTGTVISSVSTNPYHLTGLSAYTSYDVYVRQNCGGGSYSTWAGPLNFTTLINPLALPYTQSFDGATFPGGWTQSNTEWSISATNMAGGAPNEMHALWWSFTGATRLILGPINTSGASSLMLSFKHFFDDYGAGLTMKIQSSSDQVNWTDEAYSFVSGGGNIGPETVNTTIANNLGTVTYIAWVIDGNHFQYDNWYVDDVVVLPPLPNDVGTLSIDIPANIMPGSIAPKATVKNFGTSTNSFSVKMNITGGYTSTKSVTSLAPGATQQVTFDNWSPVAGQYDAQVFTMLGTDQYHGNDTLYKHIGVYSGAWAYKSPITMATFFGTGCTYSSYLLSFGGVNTSGLETECFKYDVNADAWSSIAPLPAGRDRFTSAVVGNYAYAIAGYDVTSALQVSTVYKYDIAGNSWTTVAPLPAAIGWGKAVPYNNNFIYHAGGYDGTNYRSDVFLYNVSTNTWTAATSMPIAAFGGAFSIVGNKLIYVGGATPSGLSESVYIGTIDAGNPALIVWTSAANYPGIQKSVLARNDGDLSKLINTRTTKDGSPETAVYPPGGMYRFDAAPWGTDGIIVTTGCNTDYPPVRPNPCYSYNVNTDTWTQQADLPSPAVGTSFGSVSSGTTWKLIVASGDTTGSGTPTTATQVYTANLGGTNTFPLSVNIAAGWNMVSVPGTNPDGMDITHWWINHTGTVYKFVPGSGYSGITTTLPGQGYWEKNTVTQTYNTGDEWPAGGILLVNHDPINAAIGWNMFGGYEDIVDPANLTTVPAGKIVYPIYKFVPGSGYASATQIVPGYGYWVKVSAACQIIVPNVMAKSNQKIAEMFKDDWGKITITDAAGSSYTLYAVKGDVDLNQYELPPLPPAGLFDVRFGSSRIAENINTDFKSIEMRGITYPVRIKADGMDIRLMDVTGKLINTNIKDGEEITIDNASIDKVMVSGQLIPDKYSLEQNYPNPFNPSTTIEFSLPENVKNVRISVYNVLGQKVAELVNGEMLAGRYHYQWNAKNFASGMYIYELRTEKFVSIKKMMLLK